MLNEVQQSKSYLQSGIDAVLDFTVDSHSAVGKEISRYAPTFLQTAALFTPGRMALAANVVLGAANEVRVGDSLPMQIAELGMGATKGAATRAMFNKLGNANIMVGSLWAVPAKGVVLGASTRALDIGLTPDTWLSTSGGIDAVSGMTKTFASALNPTALAMDAAIFTVAHGTTFGLNKLSIGVIDSSPALRNIVMGSTFGVTTGSTQELMRQQETGGPRNWNEIAKRGLIEGVVDGFASAPGAVLGDPGLRSKYYPDQKFRQSARLAAALGIGMLDITVGMQAGGSATEHNGTEISAKVPSRELILEPREPKEFSTAPIESMTVPLFDKVQSLNLQLSETTPRAKVVDSTGTVSGNGTVEIFGNANVELIAPAGQTLRVVIQEGSPQLRVADGNQGRIEFVNHTINEISRALFTDAAGDPVKNIQELNPLSEIFSPTEIERIREVQAQQNGLPKRQLLDHLNADIEALPESQRATAIEQRNAVQAKFDELVDQVYGSGAARKEKILHIVSGPPGAGKSSILVDPLAEKYGAFIIDSDHIKPLLDGYENGLGTNAVHADSAQIGRLVLEKAFANGDNIVYPQLGRTGPAMEQLIVRARAEGYKIGLHIADLPPDKAARRVFNRSELPPDERGIRQMVDPEFALFAVGRNPLKVFEAMISTPGMVDEFSHYDTNVHFEIKAKLVKASHTPPWMPDR